MILFLLATRAVLSNSSTINLGTAHQILRMFDLAPDGRNYRRLQERLARMFSATVSFEGLRSRGKTSVPFQKTTRIAQRQHLWFMAKGDAEPRDYSFENKVTLTPEFWAELLNFPLPIDLRVVRALLDCPANLDFYVWLKGKTCQLEMGKFLKIPLAGPRSVSDQLAAERYAEPRNFRTKIKRWLDRTKTIWPSCPAALSDDNRWLIVGHSPVVHHPDATPFLTGKRGKGHPIPKRRARVMTAT